MIYLKEDKIKVKTSFEQKDAQKEIKTLDGRSFNWDDKAWDININKTNIENVIKIAFNHNLEISKEFKDLAVKSFNDDNIKKHPMYSKLFPFQKYGVEKLSNNKRMALFDEMGLGKTIQIAVSLPKDKRVLCIVPASLKYNWQQELKVWSLYDNITFLKGRDSFRFPEINEVIITNYDILPKLMDTTKGKRTQHKFEVELDFPDDLIIIIDEIHYCKNYKSSRTIKTKLLCQGAEYVWGLSGTPLVNRPPELWQVLDTIGLARKTFFSYGYFAKLFGATKGRFGTSWGAPSPEVTQRLVNSTLRRDRKTVLPELPDKIYTTIKVDIKKSLQKKLDELIKKWEEWKKEESERLHELEKEGDKLAEKKRKILNSQDTLPPFTMLAEIRKLLASAKIPVMLEIVQQHEDAEMPLIVFSYHREPIDLLKDREGWEVITGSTSIKERNRIVEDFQAGKCKGLGATIKAAGVGLTLTYAHRALFVDLDWTPAGNKQAEDRIMRIGQKNNCEYITLIANHSIDMRLQQLLQIKEVYIKAVNDARIDNIESILEVLDKCKIWDGKEEKREVEKIEMNFSPGIYTLSNGSEHQTFRINIQSIEENFMPGKALLSLFVGSENYMQSNYKSFAFIDNKSIRVWKRHQDSDIYTQWIDILWKMLNNKNVDGFTLNIARNCLVCNKLLTNPDSIKIGIGKDCLEKAPFLFPFMF